MTPLTSRQQISVGIALAMLMLATRGQHVAGMGFLPDASWAVFFLAGLYLRPGWVFWGFNVQALAIDIAAVTWGGVSGFCLSPAYVLLLPAHAALWVGGRWCASRYRPALPALLPLAGSLLVAAVVAELLASGGFYYFSGRFADPDLAGLATRLVDYFPSSLEALALYVGLAVAIHIAFAVASQGVGRRDVAGG